MFFRIPLWEDGAVDEIVQNRPIPSPFSTSHWGNHEADAKQRHETASALEPVILHFYFF
jgi:hypothetical protein